MKFIVPVLIFTTLLLSHGVWAKNISEKIQSSEELIEVIKSGGHILYMRHGITKRKDKKSKKIIVDIANCETQRNLTKAGQAQVQHIGKAIKLLNIPIGSVISSPYCRTKDTAQAVFGDYVVDKKLAFSLTKAKDESQVLGDYLYNTMIETHDLTNNTVFVGHTANLKDGLGVWPKPEGVIAVFKKEEGGIVYKGMIKPDNWPK